MNKKIYITSVTEGKKGINKFGKPWQMYLVTDQQGNRYSTFEGRYSTLIDQEVDVIVEEKIIGDKKYLNIVEPKREQVNMGDIWFAINELRDRVEALENGKGAALGATMRELKKESSIDVESLPF